MESNETRTLARFSRRFRNFSEAAGEVLDALAEALPGVVVLGRLDPEEGVHRAIEVRGGGVSGLGGGVAIPLMGDDIDADFLRSLGAQAWLSAPLEMSNGRIAGVLCAVDARPEAYRPEDAAQLGVAARLLGHEWESVELRSELRRLRGRVNAGPGTDIETGLPDRERFSELLAREWNLTERGTVRSVLVVCRVGGGAEASGNGAADVKDRLALKLAAETLRATARETDCVGRIAEMTVGAILVGCDPQDTPAFVARFLGAFERVTERSRPEIEVSCGVQPLTGTPSPTEALELAEAAAGEPGQAPAPDLPVEALE